MTLQVLISTMNKENMNFIRGMNIKSDALIINQSNKVDYSREMTGYGTLEMFSFNERGLSISRNNALMRSKADIICIADDDMKYTDSYKEDIIRQFELHPDADIILFYVEAVNGVRKTTKIHDFSKIKIGEYRKFSSVNIVAKREKIIVNNIWFHILFGAGALYNCGEDTIFLKNILSAGLKVYKSPVKIAEVDMSVSSWFKGYDESHFNNKGALLACLYPCLCYYIAIFLSFKNSLKKMHNIRMLPVVYSWYLSGIHDYKIKSK